MFSIKKEKIVEVLRQLDIQEGTILFVHSSTGLIFGKQENPSQLLYDAIFEVIGKSGTVVVPTFTFACCHGKLYDPMETDSETGQFTNFVRKIPGALRSNHPIHSVSAVGRDAHLVVNHESISSFGQKSSFNILLDLGAVNLLVGVGIQYITLIHQAEEDLVVPYRFYKEFDIEVKEKGRITRKNIPYFAKYQDRKITYKLDLMEETIRMHNAMPIRRVGWGNIGRCDFKIFYNLFREKMCLDPYFLIDKEEYLKSI